MLGDTFTVTLDGSGGTAVVCSKINQDNFSAEYFKKDSGNLYDIRVRVRHSKESPTKEGIVFDRHNVEITQTVYATATLPQYVRQAYAVIRNQAADDLVGITNVVEALSFWLTDANSDKLIGWES